MSIIEVFTDFVQISNIVLKYLKKMKKLKILVALLNQKDSNILLEEEMKNMNPCGKTKTVLP